MKKNYVTICTPAGHPMRRKFTAVYNAMHHVLNAEHMGEARNHVKNLRQFTMARLTARTPESREDACLRAIFCAVNHAETQTLEELHACLRGTLALIDITVED